MPWDLPFWLQEDTEAIFDTQREILVALGRPLPDSYKKHPGRRGHTVEHYQQVADAYLALTRQGVRNPVARIAKEWGYAPGTVRAWVFKARERGLIPPATKPGTAG